MADTFKMTLSEGGEVEVWEDLDDGVPVAILFVKSVLQTLGESIHLVGVEINLPDRQDYVLTANCRLDGGQAEALIEALRAATRDDEERSVVVERVADIRDLYGTTDAQVWAREFIAIFGARLLDIDEGLMIGWFANAIEVGRRAGEVGVRLVRQDFACRKCGSLRDHVRYHRDASDCPALERQRRTEGEHLHYTCLDCEFDWTGDVVEPEPEGDGSRVVRSG